LDTLYRDNFIRVNDPMDAHVLLTDITRVNVKKYPKTKYVVCPCTNVNHINTRTGVLMIYLNQHDDFMETITSTAEHTIFLMLSLMRKFNYKDSYLRPDKPLDSLRGKTIGLLGYGRIGMKVAELVKVFGAKVISYDPKYNEYNEREEVIETSDILSIHATVGKKPRGFILSKVDIGLLKEGTYVINTSRGEAIDEGALLERLPKLGGFAADVLTGEPNPKNYEIFKSHSNVILTPHIGGYTKQDFEATFVYCIDRLIKEVKA